MTSSEASIPDELHQNLEKAFKVIDADNSGYIDAAEVENLIKTVYNDPNYQGAKVDDEQIKKEAEIMLAALDENSDKKISLSEFINFCSRVLSAAQKA